jgi:hypothetical protein
MVSFAYAGAAEAEKSKTAVKSFTSIFHSISHAYFMPFLIAQLVSITQIILTAQIVLILSYNV